MRLIQLTIVAQEDRNGPSSSSYTKLIASFDMLDEVRNVQGPLAIL